MLLHFLEKASKVKYALSTKLGRRGVSRRVFCAVEHRQALSAYTFKTIVDVGANRGQFSLLMRRLYPDARIHAFEPLERPASLYRDVFAGDDHVTLHQTAIGPTTRSSTMFVTAKDDSSSLLPVGETQSMLFNTRVSETRTVSEASLASILRPEDLVAPALLKIDTQGYEYQVLLGCAELLPHFSHIYVEASFVELYKDQVLLADVYELLQKHNFRLRGAFNQVNDERLGPIQADFLFERAPQRT